MVKYAKLLANEDGDLEEYPNRVHAILELAGSPSILCALIPIGEGESVAQYEYVDSVCNCPECIEFIDKCKDIKFRRPKDMPPRHKRGRVKKSHSVGMPTNFEGNRAWFKGKTVNDCDMSAIASAQGVGDSYIQLRRQSSWGTVFSVIKGTKPGCEKAYNPLVTTMADEA